MNEGQYEKLIEICGNENVSRDPNLLKTYSKDESFVSEKMPSGVIWPKNVEQVEQIIKLANDQKFSIVPVSSKLGARIHGDTIPRKDDSIVMDLSKMNKILNIDTKNRVVMVEPGVTFGELIPILRKNGVRTLIPLHPRSAKSVLASALEREPITIPKYHWDSSDPLLCTELVFGSGDLFRTGTAAGPGTIKQLRKVGQAQANPMGPTQFDPFRIVQGSQGSLGVVTWVSLKLEYFPDIQKVVHVQSDKLQELLDFQHELIKYRLCDELLILNNLNLASLIKQKAEDIREFAKSLKKWNLIYVVSGRGQLANERVAYLSQDIEDKLKNLKLGNLKDKSPVNDSELLNALNQASEKDWRTKLTGAFQDIFFLSNLERIPNFVAIVEKNMPQNLGVYIQPTNQGTSLHCEFDLFYDKGDSKSVDAVKELFSEVSVELMDNGAFFNRPYGLWAPEVYKRQEEMVVTAIKKVKAIFDPNHVLSPGTLCFTDKL